MSDTFDHEGDAWDSYERGLEDQEPYQGYSRRSTAAQDPLYYHKLVTFRKMTNTTEKAVELELADGKLIWIPRSVCRRWSDGAVYIHKKTLKESMKKARDPGSLADLLTD
jgi:hypothetical protein